MPMAVSPTMRRAPRTIVSSRLARGTVTSRTPRTCWSAACAWHAAFQQLGSFSIGLIKPASRSPFSLRKILRRSGRFRRVSGCSWGVAGDAGLDSLVHERAHLVLVGREADPPLLVVDPDAPDAGLGADRRDDVVDLVAVVVQHAVAGAALDRLADPVGGGERPLLEVPAMEAGVLPANEPEDQAQAGHQVEHQLDAETPGVEEPYPGGGGRVERSRIDRGGQVGRDLPPGDRSPPGEARRASGSLLGSGPSVAALTVRFDGERGRAVVTLAAHLVHDARSGRLSQDAAFRNEKSPDGSRGSPARWRPRERHAGR